MEICPCSPDTGDCARCKKECVVDKMGSCLTGGKRRSTKRWIQEVVKHMKKDAFTKQAMRHSETPEEYANDVLKHPKKHTLKTRRRAQFLVNIRKTKRTSRATK